MPAEAAGQRLGQIVVAKAEDAEPVCFGKDRRAECPGDDGAGRREQPGWHPAVFHSAAQAQRGSLEIHANDAGQTGDHRRERVAQPRWRVHFLQGERGLPADDPMDDQRAQHRSQQDAAQKPAIQVADDFLKDKGRGRQRSVEGGRQSGRGARGRSSRAAFAWPRP